MLIYIFFSICVQKIVGFEIEFKHKNNMKRFIKTNIGPFLSIFLIDCIRQRGNIEETSLAP